MIDPNVSLPANVEQGSDRRRALGFAVTVGAVLLAIAGYKWWRSRDLSTAVLVLGSIALGLVLLALILPRAALVLRNGWLRFGALLGKINSTIILSVMYVVVLTPLGLIMRFVGRKSFRPAPGAEYVKKRTPRDPKHFERPY